MMCPNSLNVMAKSEPVFSAFATSSTANSGATLNRSLDVATVSLDEVISEIGAGLGSPVERSFDLDLDCPTMTELPAPDFARELVATFFSTPDPTGSSSVQGRNFRAFTQKPSL